MQEKINELISEELQRSMKYPLFHSAHEGFAVLLEELDEAKEEVAHIELLMKMLWANVRLGSKENCILRVEQIEEATTKAIAELIQVAAMCRKFSRSMKGE